VNSAKKDLLLQAEKTLENTIAQPWSGREQAWLEALRKTLSQVEGALFRHETPSEGELLSAAEPVRKESAPGLTRDVQTLRQEHTGVSQQLNALLASIQITSPKEADFTGFRQGGEKLLQTLREFRETEHKLIQETANRDTGAGD